MPRISDTTCRPCQVPSVVPAEENIGTNHTAYHLIVLLGCAAILAASFIFRPGEEGVWLFGYPWPLHCWLHETFGIRCALCGMSRSLCWLAHGDAAASLAFHRLGPVTFLFFCLQIPYRLYALAIQPGTVGRTLVKVHLGLAALLCAAMACNWLIYLEGLIL